MKYTVVVHYEGAVDFDVEAANEEEASEKAEAMFADIDIGSDLIGDSIDFFTDDVLAKDKED